VLVVEQVVPLSPSEWELLDARQLEARAVNAANDADRTAAVAELEALRTRVASDRAVVLLGRTGGGGGSRPTAVLIASGMGAESISPGASVRVVPIDAAFPSSSLGSAEHAFPSLRTFGTPTAPGFIAESFEVTAAPSGASAAASVPPAPWARRTAMSLPESSNLVTEGVPAAGAMVNGRVPVSVTVRNAGTRPLPACEVFFEMLDSSGAVIHREFAWITPQRSWSLEPNLPALAPGDRATIDVPLPPEIAARSQSCRVLIVKMFSGARSKR